MRPFLERQAELHEEERCRMRREIDQREEEFRQQLRQLEAQLETSQDDARQGLRSEMASREAAHQQQIKALEEKLESATSGSRWGFGGGRKRDAAPPHEAGDLGLIAAAAFEQQASDLSFIKAAAFQQQMAELDIKTRDEWVDRTRGSEAASACSIQ